MAKSDLHIYPDPGQTSFRRAVASYIGLGVEADNIVGGSGADDLIDILIRRLFFSRVLFFARHMQFMGLAISLGWWIPSG